MRETDAKPSLRISHIVYGRENAGGRVTYLIHPKGLGEERAIPEQVVLRRWRQRQFPGYTFSGGRLSSTVWRALPVMLGRDVRRWASLDVETLRRLREAKIEALRALQLLPPAAETVRALFDICGVTNIGRLVERHAAFAGTGVSGVPDLFLFARDERGRVGIARFVEVKKPEEPVSAAQFDEIRVLQSLGLHARVLRLEER